MVSKFRYGAIIFLAGLSAAGCHRAATNAASLTPPQTQAQIQAQMNAVQNAPNTPAAVKEGTLKMLEAAKSQSPAPAQP